MRKWLIAAGAAFITTVLVVVAVFGFFVLMIASGGGEAQADICLPAGQGPTGSGSWRTPLVGKVTSPFGSRSLRGEASHHDGTDIAGVPEGTPFFSASNGTVIAAYGNGSTNPTGDTGNGIIIDAGDGINLWYWHAQNSSTKVRPGQKVTTGQQLASVGNTGNSTGAHLHFQVMVNGQPVDPQPFMKSRGVTLGQGDTSAAKTPLLPTIQAPTGMPPSLTSKTLTGLSITLDQRQLATLAQVVSAARSAKMSDKAITIALVTVLQESKARMYANTNVPESMNRPHEEVGHDHDSVGIFQQRPGPASAGRWGTVEDLMDVRKSTLKFFGLFPGGPWPVGLTQVTGWEQMAIGDAAQRVQVSAFPDAYAQWEPVAKDLLAKLGGGSTEATNCRPADAGIAGQDLPGVTSGVRAKVIAAAKEGLGGNYVWGGTAFKNWDCSGFVLWAYTKAGIKGVPRTEQWKIGTKTTTPQPGDLVVQNPDGPGHWAHVGIYAGNGKMYSALNPSVGTILHPVDWNPGSEYFTITQ